MTSSDVLDTCFNLQLKQAGKILIQDIDKLLKTLKSKSNKYKSIIQNPNESIKSKDDIIFKNIKPIPVKKEPWGYVMDSVVL